STPAHEQSSVRKLRPPTMAASSSVDTEQVRKLPLVSLSRRVHLQPLPSTKWKLPILIARSGRSLRRDRQSDWLKALGRSASLPNLDTAKGRYDGAQRGRTRRPGNLKRQLRRAVTLSRLHPRKRQALQLFGQPNAHPQ